MASEQLFESLTCSCVPGGPQGTLSRPGEAMVGACTCMGSVDARKAARAPCRAVPCRQAFNKYYCMNMLIAKTHPAGLTYEEREQELRIHLFCKFCLLKATVWFGVRSVCSGVYSGSQCGLATGQLDKPGQIAVVGATAMIFMNSCIIFEYKILHLKRFLGAFAFFPPPPSTPCLQWCPTALVKMPGLALYWRFDCCYVW